MKTTIHGLYTNNTCTYNIDKKPPRENSNNFSVIIVDFLVFACIQCTMYNGMMDFCVTETKFCTKISVFHHNCTRMYSKRKYDRWPSYSSFFYSLFLSFFYRWFPLFISCLLLELIHVNYVKYIVMIRMHIKGCAHHLHNIGKWLCAHLYLNIIYTHASICIYITRIVLGSR